MNTSKKIKIELLGDRVAVTPIEKQQKTASGIIIPENTNERSQEGHVIAVGPGKAEEVMTLKVGDRVLFGEYSGKEVKIEGEKYLILRESDVYCKIAA